MPLDDTLIFGVLPGFRRRPGGLAPAPASALPQETVDVLD